MGRIKFNIRKDMSNMELYNELHGRISGETQGQAQVTLQSIQNGETDVFINPTNEYSLVRVTATTQDLMNNPVLSYRYFLMGVNDEGLYFTHELNANDVWRCKTFDELIMWVNRADEGFSHRIQGDILVQFVKPLKRDLDSEHNKFEVILLNGNCVDYWEKMDPERYTQRGYVGNMFGNHKIISNNIYFSSRDYRLVQDKELILEHPQHGITKMGIPEGFSALLATQRGRSGQSID